MSGFVIGIGASAGGLEALTSFFRAAPADSGLVFIVVQHLSPNTKSMLHELLAAHTAMPVIPAENGMSVAPNCVYLQPPQTNLNLFKGKLLLDDAAALPGLHLPIDYFFRSLAEDQKDRAVGIILSGTGSDGSRGLSALRQTGGMIMVQDPADARFNVMPSSAIATGLADYICPAAELPVRLMEYIQQPRRKESGTGEDAELVRIIALLRTQCNVDFSLYKPSTILRRINRRMVIARCEELRDYVEFLMQRPQEVKLLFRDLLIGVTKFFRDHKEFTYLREQVIPCIFENSAAREEIRVWDAGCSSGEEAYTVAMLLHDHLVRQQPGRRCKIKVFATDLDQRAIDKAAKGFYPDGIAADLPSDLLKKYFSRVENGFIVRRHIRELVIFAQQNLLSDPPFTRLDLIVCRNLLIYFHAPQQKEVLGTFHFALNEGGFLFLGSSESVLDMGDSFAAVDSQIKIYRHIGRGGVPLHRGLGLAAGKPSQKDETAELTRRLETREFYYQRLVSRLAAACVVLSETGEVLESFGRTDLILQPQPGQMSLNISSMISSALLLPVTTALRACQREAGWEVVYEGIKVSEKNNDRYLLRAVHLAEDNSVLIALEKMPAHFDPAGQDKKKTSDVLGWQMVDLQREVQFARENLEAANEELQTSNEELLAANEELIASNEAMQHTNEELNSVNEELSTVNAEYQAKIMELTELYNDLDNLFRSTDIGFVFVDRQLRIRKYTPAAGKLMRLMEHDLGRRISDLAAPLLGDIEAEFNDLLLLRKKKEKIVRHSEDCWYLVQFIPYMDETSEVSGMVVSIVDVSLQKRAEESLRQSSGILEQILAASPAPTMMVTQEGRISFANEMAAALFGLPASQLLDQPLCSGQFDFADLDGREFPDAAAFVRAVTGQAEPLIVRLKDSGGGGEYFLSIRANTLSGRSSGLNGVVLTFTEVARRNN
jgi:two-component system CheB/CheR fusion protein